jgi:excinuclease ABC subunit C
MASLTKEKPDLQKRVHEVPHKPGVYLMRDRFNRPISCHRKWRRPI